MIPFIAMLLIADPNTYVVEHYATQAQCTAHLTRWVQHAHAAGYAHAFAVCG